MGLELKDLEQQVKEAHIRTFKAWAMVCEVINQPYNPHRRDICQAYIAAVRDECNVIEKYTQETGLIPDLTLPFELYYLYYQGAAREKWKKICDAYKTRKEKACLKK